MEPTYAVIDYQDLLSAHLCDVATRRRSSTNLNSAAITKALQRLRAICGYHLSDVAEMVLEERHNCDND